MSKPVKILLVATGIIAGLFIIVSAVAVSGVWNFQNKKQVSVESQEKEKPEEKNPAPADVSKNDDVSMEDWKTYRNEEYGFEVQYPEKFDLKSQAGSSGKFSISFFPKDKSQVTSAALNSGSLLNINNNFLIKNGITPYLRLSEFKKSVLAGKNVASQVSFMSNDLNWFCYVPDKTKAGKDVKMETCITENPKDNFYQFDFYFDEKTQNYFSTEDMKRLVKSFILISDNQADWKTYRNEEYGFEIKYPGSLKLNDLDKKFVVFQSSNNIMTNPDNYIDVRVEVFNSEKPLNDWYKAFQPLNDDEQVKKSENFGGEQRNFLKEDLIIKTEYFDNYIKHYIRQGVIVWETPPMTFISYYYKNGKSIFKVQGVVKTEETEKMMPILEEILNSFKYK
jgi:hypothetical protein